MFEPKEVKKALEDLDWTNAMQEETKSIQKKWYMVSHQKA